MTWGIYWNIWVFFKRERLNLLLASLVGMSLIGGNEYNFIEFDKVNTKFVHGQG